MSVIKIFLSQSGEDSEKLALIFKNWIKDIFKNHVEIFISTSHIELGTDWFYKLNNKLQETDIGIFFLTEDSIKSDWLLYEAGAISTNIKKIKRNNKKLKKTSVICSVLVDIEQDNLPEPFQKLQNFSYNDESSLLKLLKLIHSYTSISVPIREIERDFSDKWINKIKKSYKRNNNKYYNSLDLKKYKMNVQNPDCEYGIISTIPKKSFHDLRLDVVGLENTELILIGSSLSEAFDPGNEATDISFLLKDKLRNKIKDTFNLKIILSEPEIFSTNYDYTKRNILDETPVSRINRTLMTILSMLKEFNHKLKVSIYFIPLLQIDHIVMTSKYMIIRHTMLWTYSGEFKGTRFLCKSSNNESSLYGSYKKYIEQLMKLSIRIEENNYSNIYRGNFYKTDSDKFHKNWRKEFSKYSKNVNIYKLYREQLISDLHSTWDYKYRNYFPDINVTHEEDIFNYNYGINIKSKRDLYNYNNLIGDKTQQVLLEYLKTTESMLDSLMKRYDNNGGFAHIYPSFDLGIPNNIQRLAGGFATGIYVTWRCGTPIIPIDTTVNGCTSSVYKLNSNSKTKIENLFNINILKEVFEKGNQYGYLHSFDSGNHFISLCKDSENDYYLVLHASAKEFKYTRLGLYPHNNSWFKNDIKILYNKEKTRYIRYLKGEVAKEFIKIAEQLPSFNEDVHNWYANKIAQLMECKITKVSLKHHYYMPTTYSVAMGTFLEKPNEIVPIFSGPGNDIHLFKITDNPIWTLLVAGEEKCLVPHGWGQEVKGSLEISLYDDKILNINNVRHNISEGVSINTNKINKKIRTFDTKINSNNSFYKIGEKYFQGKIVKTLNQLVTYQNGIIKRYINE